MTCGINNINNISDLLVTDSFAQNKIDNKNISQTSSLLATIGEIWAIIYNFYQLGGSTEAVRRELQENENQKNADKDCWHSQSCKF